MKSSLRVIKELVQNLVIINRLAIHDLITKNKGNLLGFLWLWINPSIQVAIYAFVFGYGIRKSAPVDGNPFFYWLIPGFIMWVYINSVVTTASRSIVAKMGLITKMRFPVSITPAVVVLSELYVHIMMVITIMVVLWLGGYTPNKYWLILPYFTFSATTFLYSLSLFNSALTTMFRDYQHVVYNLMRTMFFVTPVIFPMDSMASGMQLVLKVNPFTYLIEGYRQCLIFESDLIFLSVKWGVYFWAVTVIFFILGSVIHVKMRKNLLDHA